jgi:hypothetical protein
MVSRLLVSAYRLYKCFIFIFIRTFLQEYIHSFRAGFWKMTKFDWAAWCVFVTTQNFKLIWQFFFNYG